MSSGLVDPLRHNSWARGPLLAFSRDLRPEQFQATSEGNYGSILATLQHVIGAEGRYRYRLSGAEPPWLGKPEEVDDLGELTRMAEDNAACWEELATGEFDGDRVCSWVSTVSGAHSEAAA